MWLNGLILLTLLAIVNCIETELTVEAAFQGHCGHNSPCEQLCYEIHDGMYECDCTEGYELNKNGYSCQELNSTYLQDNNMKSEEDILYQKGVSFSAKLDNNSNNNNNDFDNNDMDLNSISSGGNNSDNDDEDNDDDDDDDDIRFTDNNNYLNNNNAADDILDTNISSEEIFNNNNNNNNQNQLTLNNNNVPENINIKISNNSNDDDFIIISPKKHHLITSTKTTTTTTSSSSSATLSQTAIRPTLIPSISALDLNNLEYYDIYYANKDMSVYDDVNNNKLNLRPVNPDTYQNDNIDQHQQNIKTNKNYHKEFVITTTTTIKSNIEPTLNENISKNNIILNSQNDKIVNNDGRKNNNNSGGGGGISNFNDFEKKLDNKKHINVENNYSWKNLNSTFNGIKEISSPDEILPDSQKNFLKACLLDCGSDGICDYIDGGKNMRCLCTFGKGGKYCADDIKVNIPRFTHKSWLAFPALRGAYKHVQLRVEFRPESFNGIILLTGERDDLTGDFMAILIHQGFIEFWFDCGSGVGNVRSKETVQINQWNSVTIYRHRWDAWLVLNHGSRVQGRSTGLFSRITFREPVFLGGTGNITGLAKRLPIHDGMIGCIRRFIANEHEYKFTEHPLGDVTKGFDIQDCTTDKCVKYPCQHGGKCLPSDQGAVCLCPLGFGGDLCEMRLDLQVPSFNGSSYLRYSPIGDSALIWLELQIILKPHQEDGIILYSGHEEYGDYIALSLNMGYVEFAFDLGSGPALVRSEYPLSMGKWHTIKISRTARLAVLRLDQHSEVMTISSNGFWHLSLPHSLFLGGIHNVQHLPLGLKDKGSFVGCIQKVEINGHSLSIISEALGGTNIDNCPHACVARPCGPLAQCLPILDSYECHCNPFNAQCNKAEEVSLKQIPLIINNNNNNNNNEYDNEDYKKIKDNSHKTINNHHNKNIDNIKYKSIKTNINQSNMAIDDNIKSIKENKQINNQLKQKISDVYYYDYDDEQHDDINNNNNNQKNKTKKNFNFDNINKTFKNNLNDKIKSDEKLLLLSSSMNHKNIDGVIKSQFSLTTSPQPDIIQQKQIQSNQYISINNYDDIINDDDDNKNIKNNINLLNEHEKILSNNQKVNNKINHVDDKINNNDNDDDIIVTASMKKAQVDVENDQFIITTTTTKINRKKLKNHNHQHHPKYNYHLHSHQQHNRYHNKHINEHDVNSNKTKTTIVDDKNYQQTSKKEMKQHQQQQQQQQQHHRREHSTFLVDDRQQQDDYQAKVLIEDMERIMKNGVNDLNTYSKEHDIDDNDEDDDEDDSDMIDDFNLNNSFIKVPIFRKNLGACFTGTDSYFHYNDAETMSQIISYKIDLNLRFKTHSNNGIILWSGRYSALETDDFLSLGIENGYLHFRYNLGSGETNICFNTSKVSDGLWHRVRAMRNSQEGFLEVDGRKSRAQRSPGKLRQLNTDTGLFVGGMNKVTYYTRRRYFTGIVGCISEIILAGELRLNLDPATLGTAHNVETGIL